MDDNCIKIKRVYLPPAKADGCRILIDRLWPRGLKKEAAHIHLWLKEIAPSSELRKWFNHDPKKWVDFKKRYLKELTQKQASLHALIEQIDKRPVTLLYGAKDERYNQAVVLQEFLGQFIKKSHHE